MIKIDQITEDYGVTKFNGLRYPVVKWDTIHREYKTREEALVWLIQIIDADLKRNKQEAKRA